VYTVTPDNDILVAAAAFLQLGISGAPVIDSNRKVVGVLSKRDCLKAVLNAHYHQDRGGMVQDYMVQPVETLDSSTELTEAAVKFVNSRYRRFPITEDDKLIGQVSRSDILQALFDNTPLH
jgi:CBS domain-containing protein